MASERVEANEHFEHACEDREPKESSEKIEEYKCWETFQTSKFKMPRSSKLC